jgi:two-component system sensor histidine kinase BaeS
LIAFLLSRYLLRPVRKLTEGTLAIAERRFDTRVKIDTSDEFGQLATDFNAMAKTLDSFEQQRQQWISDISHELGTPLSVLRGEIEAMQDGIRKPNPERFESLHAEVLYLARIVDDLKLLSRVEAGQLNLCKVELDPVKLLQQALEQYADRLAERGITIQNKLPQQSGKTAMVDPDRLRQVFLNLLENVVRYVNSPATLTAQSKNTEDSLTLILEDSGQGVTEEALTNLFDRFYRTDFSRNRETGGSGLGLAICKNLIETHGGSIHAESVEPHGLRIVIKIDTAVDLE